MQPKIKIPKSPNPPDEYDKWLASWLKTDEAKEEIRKAAEELTGKSGVPIRIVK